MHVTKETATHDEKSDEWVEVSEIIDIRDDSDKRKKMKVLHVVMEMIAWKMMKRLIIKRKTKMQGNVHLK